MAEQQKRAKRKRVRLEATQEQLDQLTALLRGGTFLERACLAVGLPVAYVRQMLKQGKPRQHKDGRWSKDPKWTPFYDEVMRCEATTAAEADAECYRENKLAWSRFGPGRATKDRVGWSSGAEAKEVVVYQEANIFQDPTFLAMIYALEAFPEARAAVAEALKKPEEAKRTRSLGMVKVKPEANGQSNGRDGPDEGPPELPDIVELS
jgi:hypothetical protein